MRILIFGTFGSSTAGLLGCEGLLLIASVFGWVTKFFELLLGIELTFNLIMRGCSEVELDGLWDPDLCLVRSRSLSSWALSGSVVFATTRFSEGSTSLSEALSLDPASNWPVTGLISNGRTLGVNDCFEGDMSTLWTTGEDFTEGLSPVSMQRSSAGLVWTGGWGGLEGVTLTLLIVLGTGLRVTAELGGGISL